MKIEFSKKCLCPCCMEEHEVKRVQREEKSYFKDVPVMYEASYWYCDRAEELFQDEQQITDNDIAMKDAYRKIQGLLTSAEIVAIREKYKINQGDLCTLLGWGGKTITRYEGHQVQDRAHDMILRKLDQDPEWFLELLELAGDRMPGISYQRSLEAAMSLYEKEEDSYLRKAIEAQYVGYEKEKEVYGDHPLSLDKTVDVIRYFASFNTIESLYKEKMARLMLYADALSYEKRNCSITGLLYQGQSLNVFPVGYDIIINLKGISYEPVDAGETQTYRFVSDKKKEYPSLTEEDKKILETAVKKLGRLDRKEGIAFLRNYGRKFPALIKEETSV